MDIGPIMDYHATKNLGMGMSFSVSYTPKMLRKMPKNGIFGSFFGGYFFRDCEIQKF